MRITFLSTDCYAVNIPDDLIPEDIDKNDPEAVFRWYDSIYCGSGIFDTPVGIEDYAFDFKIEE